MPDLYRFPSTLNEDLKDEIRATNDSQWLKDMQQQCAENRERYQITYDQSKEGFVCGVDIIHAIVPIAIYSGTITLCRNKARVAELRGEKYLHRDELNLDDFNRYRIMLTDDPFGKGVLLLTGDPDDDSVPRVMRAEFANHSCNGGNCTTKLQGPRNVPVIVLYTKDVHIPSGSELTFWYGRHTPKRLDICEALVERLQQEGHPAHVVPCKCSGGRCEMGFIHLDQDDAPSSNKRPFVEEPYPPPRARIEQPLSEIPKAVHMSAKPKAVHMSAKPKAVHMSEQPPPKVTSRVRSEQVQPQTLERVQPPPNIEPSQRITRRSGNRPW